jgi:allantoicase
MEVHTITEAILAPLSRSSNSELSVLPVPSALIDTTFSSTTNLSSTVLNAQIVSFSDEYFASASNLLTHGPAIRKEGYYVHTGAWYDGWETRRHNKQEFDWVVMKLGVVGKIEGVEVDTAHFNGNEAPEAALEGCWLTDDEEKSSGVEKDTFAGWQEILPKQPCGPSQRQAWKLTGPALHGKEFTHLRLKMYPDGGIARLRVYGSVVPPPLLKISSSEEKPLEDLASALNGGVAVACSDQHFGVKSNLILPGRGKDMGDGWETARSRTKAHVDWVVIRLGLKGRTIEKVIVDTKDFRGNFPRAVKVEGWKIDDAKAALGTEEEPKGDSPGWVGIVKGEHECEADKEHVFEGESLLDGLTLSGQLWTHVKMTIIPDGGVKRIRVLGRRR